MARHGENIRKRKDGRWEGRYKVFSENKGKYVYRSVYSNAYEKVKEKLSKIKFSLVNQAVGEKQEKKPDDTPKCDVRTDIMVLFSQAAGEWLEDIANKRKYSTYIKYNTIYKTHLAKMIGSCRLTSDAAQGLQKEIFDHLSEAELSESLQKSILCVTNQILYFANRKYSAGVSPLKRPEGKPKKKSIRTLSKTEQAKIFSEISNGSDKFKMAVLLCLYTGLRLGELCALQWKDIDFKNMTLTVNRTVQRIAVQGHVTKTILLESDPKSESSKRTIPLTCEILELLSQLKGNRSYVFGGKKPLEPRTMQYQFKKMVKTAELDDRNFHILRHTFATNCVENGMDVKTLSEILGHSDVKITLNRYVHPTMDSKRKQIGMLPDFYGQICGQAA